MPPESIAMTGTPSESYRRDGARVPRARLLRAALLAAALSAVGCGPKQSPGATDSNGTTGTTADGTASTSTGGTTMGSPTSTDAPTGTTGTTDGPAVVELTPDQQICVDLCLNLIAHDEQCVRADFSCYDWCINGLEYADGQGCGDAVRSARTCEAQASAFDPMGACQTGECAAQYVAHEVCQGYCFYFDGIPYGGASQTDCEWGSSCQGGHTFDMVCAATTMPTCSCMIDGAEVGSCQHDGELVPFDCGGEDFHVFKGCCNQFFLDVLGPAPVGEFPDAGGGDGPGGAVTGAACPLRGLYVACDLDGEKGLAFCDDLGSGLQFGECILDPVCELAGPLFCEMHCELIDGAPAWVEDECMGGET
jgi:hypothetical protein